MSEVNEILFSFNLLDLPRERLIVSVYTEGSIWVDRGCSNRGGRAGERERERGREGGMAGERGRE